MPVIVITKLPPLPTGFGGLFFFPSGAVDQTVGGSLRIPDDNDVTTATVIHFVDQAVAASLRAPEDNLSLATFVSFNDVGAVDSFRTFQDQPLPLVAKVINVTGSPDLGII